MAKSEKNKQAGDLEADRARNADPTQLPADEYKKVQSILDHANDSWINGTRFDEHDLQEFLDIDPASIKFVSECDQLNTFVFNFLWALEEDRIAESETPAELPPDLTRAFLLAQWCLLAVVALRLRLLNDSRHDERIQKKLSAVFARLCSKVEEGRAAVSTLEKEFRGVTDGPVCFECFSAQNWHQLAIRVAERFVVQLCDLADRQHCVQLQLLAQAPDHRFAEVAVDWSEVIPRIISTQEQKSLDLFSENLRAESVRVATQRRRDQDQPEAASSTRPRKPVVVLQGQDANPIVLGKPQPLLSKARYLVVEALLKAGTNGLSKEGLEKVKGDAIKYLRELKKTSPEWKEAIVMAGTAHVGYRILHQ